VSLRTCQACLLATFLLLMVAVPVNEGSVPKRGSWSGHTSQHRPVTFGVSGRVHRSIKNLEIGTAGPPAKGVKMSCSADPNDFIDSRFRTFDSIKVTRAGAFSDSFETQGSITHGTLTISGSFKTKTKVRGRLRWKVTRSDNGSTCDSGPLTFSTANSSSQPARR
jgi:hypothetical protein